MPKFTTMYGTNSAASASPHSPTTRTTFPLFSRANWRSAPPAPGRSAVSSGTNTASPATRNHPV